MLEIWAMSSFPKLPSTLDAPRSALGRSGLAPHQVKVRARSAHENETHCGWMRKSRCGVEESLEDCGEICTCI